MTDKTKSANDAAKPAADLQKSQAAKSAPMSDADLDKVAGGINPQPLPPIVHIRQ
jgi:hypothetical protein